MKFCAFCALSKSLYPRAESNRNRQNRNLKFYPLNYGGLKGRAKLRNFYFAATLNVYFPLPALITAYPSS